MEKFVDKTEKLEMLSKLASKSNNPSLVKACMDFIEEEAENRIAYIAYAQKYEYNRGLRDGKIIAKHGTTMYIE